MRLTDLAADVHQFYEEVSYLGGGGYGDVYKMTKIGDDSGTCYAVKIMKQVTAVSTILTAVSTILTAITL